MNISRYVGYFHDGSIIDIQYRENELLISMESSEMSEEDLYDDVPLTKNNTLKGILHCMNIHNALLDEKPFPKDKIQMLGDSATILRMEISATKIHLFLEWISYPPKHEIELYSDIVIETQKTYWENVPDLYDPFGE